jgi:ATP-dependent DNA helicase 2 subunit 2
VDYEQYQSNNCPDMVKINYDNWHHLVSRSRDGDILSLTEAYELTQEDFVKEVRPTPSYRGYLYLGHPLENNHFVAINIFMYLRTKEVRPKTSHKWSSLSNGPTYSIVSNSKYMLDTGDNKEGISVSDEVEIPKEELERAYKYGKTIVRIAEEEMKYQQAKTRKEMTIIGFIPAATVSHMI